MVDSQVLGVILVVFMGVGAFAMLAVTVSGSRTTGRRAKGASAAMADAPRQRDARRGHLGPPIIQFTLEPGQHWPYLFEVAISNIGESPAHDVTITTLTRDVPPPGPGQPRPWEDESLFNEPIPVLHPRQEVRTDVFTLREVFENQPNRTVLEFTISYRDAAGREYCISASHNLGFRLHDHAPSMRQTGSAVVGQGKVR